MADQKKLTKNYFDEVAKNWFKKAYDLGGKFLNFPTGRVRQDITVSEMKRLGSGKKVIDLGCGTGQLVIDLLKNGYGAIGIDNAQNMVVQARQALLKELPKADPSTIFLVNDVLCLDIVEKFDVVTAMGLLQYLEDDITFFTIIKKLLNKNGYAFIECRNRLFNIGSGNQYMLEAAHSGDLNKLVSQLDGIQRYSPTSIKEIQKIQRNVFSRIAKFMKEEFDSDIINRDNPPNVKSYPVGMIRKQHTPEELEGVLKKIGLSLEYVIYYHCHPYLPRYEKLFPKFFNRIGFLMQPLGYTVLGATICSSFIAVVKKPS